MLNLHLIPTKYHQTTKQKGENMTHMSYPTINLQNVGPQMSKNVYNHESIENIPKCRLIKDINLITLQFKAIRDEPKKLNELISQFSLCWSVH